MNKFVIYFVEVLVIVTFFVAMIKPVMHKQVMITDANLTFVEEISDTVDSSSNISQVITPESTKQVKVNQTPVNSQKTEKNKIQKNQSGEKNTSKKIQVTSPVKSQKQENKHQSMTTQTKAVSKPVSQNTVENSQTTKKMTSLEKKEVNKSTESSKPVVRQLTEQEEIIAWNKWRSDLQNQVMKDTKINAPLGTTFKFSFTVDKFGNLSNIKVWSTTPLYSETAVRVIKPVLVSYQGKPILNFPQGTKRIITNVTGGFTMATTTGYSKPSDYSDYERVKK